MTKTSANQVSAADDALVLKLQKEIQHLKDILNLKRKGGAQDLHQQLLVLKEENSKLRDIVIKQGDTDRLREENFRMRHELMVLKSNPNDEESNEKLMLMYRESSPTLTEERRTRDELAQAEGQGGFFMT